MSASIVVLALGGCVEVPGALEGSVPGASVISARTVAHSGISPAGASVALISVEGAPSQIIARFSEKTTAEAARRGVAVASPGGAHYLVRGYLSASEVEGGTAFRYVWDIFDRNRRRVQRSEDAIVVKGTSGDLWTLANDQALTTLAARSADDLAAILSQMPEAANGSSPAAAAIAAHVPSPPSPQPSPAGLRAFR